MALIKKINFINQTLNFKVQQSYCEKYKIEKWYYSFKLIEKNLTQIQEFLKTKQNSFHFQFSIKLLYDYRNLQITHIIN